MKNNLLLIIISVLLFSCKSREKAVQKTETQSEKKSEATYHIEEKTFEIVLDKSKISKDFSYKNSSEESSKQEKKNTDKGKEYYENGNLKKEWERDLSELSESTKKVFTELEEKINSEKETSKYWENSSNHYYQLLEEEKSKSKSYQMQLKAKPKLTWQWFLVGLLVGWIALPNIWRWFKSWLLRFNPYLKLVEKVKKVFGKL
jgi:hypothetical protein